MVHKILKVDPAERPEIKDILKSPCLINNQKGLDEIGKRSTADEEIKTPAMDKRIKILEVIDLKTDKGDKAEKTEKKSSFKIEITSIRDLSGSEQSHSTTASQMTSKLDKSDKSIPSGGSLPLGKEKISLKRATRKS